MHISLFQLGYVIYNKGKGNFFFFLFFWKWTTQHVWVDFVLLKGDCYSACTLMFTVARVTVAKPWNQRRGPWMDEQIKKIWYAIGHYFPIKNEIILLAGRGDYVKWDKLGLERGLPRDFSHTLNQGWGTVKKEKGRLRWGEDLGEKRWKLGQRGWERIWLKCVKCVFENDVRNPIISYN